MFYFCLLLSLILILHWLTREKIVKVTKIILFFFPVVLLAPTLDLLLSGGQGYNISYVFGNFSTLIHKFITFSWNYSDQGMTPGIKIELMAAFFLTGCYIWLKTRKVLTVLLGIVAWYIAGFILGALPSLLTILWNIEGVLSESAQMFSAEILLNHFYSFTHKISLILFPILFLELALWYWCYHKQKFKAFLKNIRGFRALHYVCMLGAGVVLGIAYTEPGSFFTTPFPSLILFVSGCSVVFAWWWAVGVNDLHDLNTDKISNQSRPLVTGILQADEVRALNGVLLFLAISGSILIRYQFFVLILLTMGLSYVYSVPPFRMKRIPFLSTFLIAMCSVLVCLAGYLLFSSDYSFYGFPPSIILTILVGVTLAFTVIHIKDINGDRDAGCITLPVLFGDKMGKRITGMLVLSAYLFTPFLLSIYVLIPFSIVFGILSYFLVNRKHMHEGPVFALYYLFLGVTLFFIYIKIQG